MRSSLSFFVSEHAELYEEIPKYIKSGRLSDISTFFMSIIYKSFLILCRGLYLRYQLKRKKYLAMNIIFIECLYTMVMSMIGRAHDIFLFFLLHFVADVF